MRMRPRLQTKDKRTIEKVETKSQSLSLLRKAKMVRSAGKDIFTFRCFLGFSGSAVKGLPGKESHYFSVGFIILKKKSRWFSNGTLTRGPGQCSSQKSTVLLATSKESWFNLSNTHPLHLIWHPQTTTSSPRQRKLLSGLHFDSDDVIAAVDTFLVVQDADLHIRALHAL